MNTRRRLVLGVAIYVAVFLVASIVGAAGYFHFGSPQKTCASCHEMNAVQSQWSASAHRTLHCRNCHGGSLTLDAHALRAHVNRVVRHFTGATDQPIRLAERDALRAHDSCRACHPQTFDDWKVSRHSANYARIFLDPEHNKVAAPADDCLRCHGMFFQGGVQDLLAGGGATGAPTFTDPTKAAQPTMPCLACHQIHAPAGDSRPPHFYDRREKTHIAAEALPVAVIRDGERPMRVSRDPRQRLCVQCHAPDSTHRLGTSDDRTPAGVHEGLSCLDCHRSHTQSAKGSCASCHPADSHCGLDVEKMDTTFLSTGSKHNIHRVACTDCHVSGVPHSRPAP